MTVFMLTYGCYSDYRVAGIFSSAEKAEPLAKIYRVEGQSDVKVTPIEVDAKSEACVIRIFIVQLKLDGDLIGKWTEHVIIRPSDAKGYGRQADFFKGFSANSYEEALKLAAEARQAFLRDQSSVRDCPELEEVRL